MAVALKRKELRADLDSAWSKQALRLVEALRARVADRGWYNLHDEVTPDGLYLGNFVERIRMEQRRGWVPDWLVAELDSIPGWPPAKSALLLERHAAGHHRALSALRDYVEKHGWGRFQSKGPVHRGINLATWINERRKEWRRGILQPWIMNELERVPGWSWTPLHDQATPKIEALRDYVGRFGWFEFTKNRRYQIVHRGVNLTRTVSNWISRRDQLSADIRARLESIPGWRWQSGRAAHEAYVAALLQLVDAAPRGQRRRVVSDLVMLAIWAGNLRTSHEDGTLDRGVVRMLEALPGWAFKGRHTAASERRGGRIIEVTGSRQPRTSKRRPQR